MHIKGKLFPILLGLSALFVEACAAFFSVYGLSKLFSGATTAVIIMATSLEVAKVVTASFLYRHWKTIHWTMKSYMTMGLLVLITITSMGIYGFLSNAFQSSTIGIEKQTAQVSLYEQEVSRLTKDKETLQIEKRELQNNLNAELKGFAVQDSARRYVDAGYRSRAVKRYQPMIDEKEKQIRSINQRLEELSTKVSDTKVRMIETGADVGPILFVAKLFKAEISTVVQYLIFVFIFVFDPLAVVLVIATNKAWMDLIPKTENVLVPKSGRVDEPKAHKLKKLFSRAASSKTEKLKNEASQTQTEEPIKFNTPNKPTETIGLDGMAPVVDIPRTIG
jgi:hypothetical protein